MKDESLQQTPKKFRQSSRNAWKTYITKGWKTVEDMNKYLSMYDLTNQTRKYKYYEQTHKKQEYQISN